MLCVNADWLCIQHASGPSLGRNAALIEAYRLMRALKKSRDEFAETRKDNEQRVQSLPKPAPQEPAVGAAGRR